MMRSLAGDLLRIWAVCTVLLGLAVLFIGFRYGFESRGLMFATAVAAGLDVWLALRCVRSWWTAGQYRWFWWL
jgi:hypothetical protein